MNNILIISKLIMNAKQILKQYLFVLFLKNPNVASKSSLSWKNFKFGKKKFLFIYSFYTASDIWSLFDKTRWKFIVPSFFLSQQVFR